ncbi:MAG TPA: DNA primase [Verrucomicrobiae bacterium]|nr:DNA primase [Verrucomicrobiae bacterium]
MAGFIPPEKLEQIRAASDIVDVIGAAIPLKRAGANFVALCPFHREKSPSFNVNPHRQIFHCFGCHKGGDVFSFVREYENLSFVDAVKRLAERANIPLEFENRPGQRETRAQKDTLLQMHEQIARRWQTALANDPAGQIARDYLAKRGVAPEAVELFRLGFAPDAWDDTVNWSKSKGYDLALAEQAGLIIRKEGTDRFYDRFRGRLMFPICDEQGRIVAFSGRVLSGDEKTAKYVNSPETPIFTKGKVFYGLDKSKRAILDAGFAVLCEGQLDLIACFMAGVKNIVAPQGTAFTGDHARILKRYADEVVLCFDSDNAGQDAAARVLDSLLGAGLAIRVVTVPAPHDPDSFIKERGGEAFQQLITKAEGFFDFYLNRLCATNDANSDRGRVAIVHDMAEALHKTRSAVLLDTYAQKTAHRLAVDPEAVRAEFKKRGRAKPALERQEAPDEPESTPAEPPPSEREFWLLRFLLLHEEQMDWVAQHLDLGWLEHATLKRILAARLAAHASQNWRGVPGLIDDLEDAAAGALITQAAAEEHTKGDLGRNIVEAVRLLRNDHFERQLATLKLRLAKPGLSEADTVQILREQADLRRARQQPFG